MSTVLVAEDTCAMREAICTLLETEFHSVVTATNGNEALDLYWKIHPELAILDVMMPGRNGYDVCRSIRATDSQTPIMILSAKSGESDKVLGLGLGADDYMVKPFGSTEFLARVSALLRRAQAGTRMAGEKEFSTFRLGNGVVLGQELVFINSQNIRVGITHREYMLLRLLSLRQGTIVPKERIMDLLWGARYIPNSRTLEQHLYNLRKKVDGNGFVISTVPRAGLMLELKSDVKKI